MALLWCVEVARAAWHRVGHKPAEKLTGVWGVRPAETTRTSYGLAGRVDVANPEQTIYQQRLTPVTAPYNCRRIADEPVRSGVPTEHTSRLAIREVKVQVISFCDFVTAPIASGISRRLGHR